MIGRKSNVRISDTINLVVGTDPWLADHWSRGLKVPKLPIKSNKKSQTQTHKLVRPSPSGGCRLVSILFSLRSEVISLVSSCHFDSWASFDNFLRTTSTSSRCMLSINFLTIGLVRYFATSHTVSLLNLFLTRTFRLTLFSNVSYLIVLACILPPFSTSICIIASCP